MDRLSSEHRSWLMGRVGSKDTAPELVVRRYLHRLGYRYRLHVKTLPGKPDMVFPARRCVILVHGCFWHGHGCKIGKLPKSRIEFWRAKIARNQERDAQSVRKLRALGWRVLTVWQCEIRDMRKTGPRLERFLGAKNKLRSTGRTNTSRINIYGKAHDT